MTDVAGWRAKFGAIAPSTNTVVEHDFNRMAPPGVTVHTGRMYIAHPALDSDAAFEALLGEIRGSINVAIRDVMTCEPDYLVMGMSSETFWGGVEGNAAFIERVRAQSALAVSTGASACRAALETLGVRRIAAFSPYQPVADKQVRRFFEESGFDVVRFTGLRCKTATAIARWERTRSGACFASSTGRTWTPSSKSAPTCPWYGWPTRRSAGSASP